METPKYETRAEEQAYLEGVCHGLLKAITITKEDLEAHMKRIPTNS